ncbi:MAG TPA: response regulator [Bacteroidota bacterium]|nr:response regulator [Bacteroidota bacterium]
MPPIKKDQHRKRILLVDDDDAFRFVVKKMLGDEGFSITPAEDGSEAIEKLQKEQFDLVLLDIFMPNVSGFEVLKFVREQSIKTKVIMVTGYSDLKLAVEAKTLGASDFIAKPVMRDDLFSTIKKALAE